MISVIIPVYNEESHISDTVELIRQRDVDKLVSEIIISDAGSTDDTLRVARLTNSIVVSSPGKGRAAQMNFGAGLASNELLYFIHADTIPPAGYSTHIAKSLWAGADVVSIVEGDLKAYADSVSPTSEAGCFMLAFDHEHWFLKTLCWFTRFDLAAFRYGDQSLFIRKTLFQQLNGFREDHIVMEDNELVKRISKKSKFVIIKIPVLTSARKYLANGIYKTQAVFFLIFFMYKLGFSQQRLVATYRKFIKQDKL